MSTLHSGHLSTSRHDEMGQGTSLDFLQTFDPSADPVEAYFECITQCSLDDGECVTVCTTILREQA
ncbi:MAG: hypothetical protein VKP63_07210 [Cyanobacteriota bacterium]|nr:hypothetical protein [Cyanobacteriota bacterium]